MRNLSPKVRVRFSVIAFQACLTGYFFWWLSDRVSLVDLNRALDSIQIHWVILTLGLLVFQQLLVAIRFGLLLNVFGKTIRLGVLLPLSWIANLLGQLSVLGIGAEVYRAYRCTRFGMHYREAIFCSVLDRFLGLSVLLAIAIISFLFSPNRLVITDRITDSAVWGDSGFGVLLIVVLMGSALVISIAVVKWQPIRSILFEIAFGGRWRNYGVIIGIATIVHLISGLVVLTLCTNFNIQLAVSDALLLTTLGLLSSLIPVSLGGWGARELFYYSYFVLLGFDGSIGFFVGLSFGLVVLTVAMMGMGFIFFNKHVFGE